MRNKYSVLYNNAVEELIQKDLKGNGVLLSRSVTVGANGIGFLWGGDNEASFSPAERAADRRHSRAGRGFERHAAVGRRTWADTWAWPTLPTSACWNVGRSMRLSLR